MGEVISSNSLNVEDIESYNDYSIFPKNVIEKYLQIKGSDDLTNELVNKIKKQIDNYHNENSK